MNWNSNKTVINTNTNSLEVCFNYFKLYNEEIKRDEYLKFIVDFGQIKKETSKQHFIKSQNTVF